MEVLKMKKEGEEWDMGGKEDRRKKKWRDKREKRKGEKKSDWRF